ncbi:MAG: hypothetical protein ACRBDL_11095 [Alphaproteobacteria bacterium]
MENYYKLTYAVGKISAAIIGVLVTYGQFFAPTKLFYSSMDSIFFNTVLCILPFAFLIFLEKFSSEKLGRWVEETSVKLEDWTSSISKFELKTAIILIAGLTLFIELIFIRWQTGLFPVFSVHKNFILLACFCGIGMGYAVADRKPILFPITIPLLAVTVLFFTLLRYYTGPDILMLLQSASIEMQTPWTNFDIHGDQNFTEQLLTYSPVIALLCIAFTWNVLLFVPMGQFCGYLMERDTSPLSSYGCNLIGSIGGVALLFILSWFWSTPTIWFVLSIAVLLWYLLPSIKAQKIGILSGAFCLTVVAWPIQPLIHKIYSPYQFIELSTKNVDGYAWFLASGSFRQEIVDLSLDNPERETIHVGNVGYFEIPYKIARSLDRLLIIGAGIGNDIAAAKKYDAKIIDAVEIDPAIPDIGIMTHPEAPFREDGVNLVAQDGRGFVRNTREKYDAVTYGGQDTTILMSHGANVRFDTYLFTKEGIQDAFNLLKDGGRLTMSFVVGDDSLIGKKIYRILENIDGASPPKVYAWVNSIPDGHHTHFVIYKGEALPPPMDFLNKTGFVDVTDQYKVSQDVYLELPSDDWPFFLMDEKMYPSSYVLSLSLILLLSTYLVFTILGTGRKGINMSYMPFFFLGTGFMLVETKAITELSLVYGSNWQVIAITIIGVLIMAFFANLWVSKKEKNGVALPFIGLLLTIIAGYMFVKQGSFQEITPLTRLIAPFLLTSPIFFSGLVFSSLFKKAENITTAMAYNIIGAMLGGVLEYNALRFGYSSLYLLAFFIYGFAWVTTFSGKSKAA